MIFIGGDTSSHNYNFDNVIAKDKTYPVKLYQADIPNLDVLPAPCNTDGTINSVFKQINSQSFLDRLKVCGNGGTVNLSTPTELQSNVPVSLNSEFDGEVSCDIKGNTLVNLLTKSYGEYVASKTKSLFIPVNVKPSTKYTIFYSVKNNNLKDDEYIVVTNVELEGFGKESVRVNPNTANGDYKVLVTSKDILPTNPCVRTYSVVPSNTGTTKIYNVMVLEGDYTNTNIEYFEGIKSVDKIEVLTRGKNLFDGETIMSFLTKNYGIPVKPIWLNNTIVRNANGEAQWTYNLKLKPNTKYTIKCDRDSNSRLFIGAWNITSTTTSSDGLLRLIVYFGVGSTSSTVISNIQLEEGTTATPYEPYKCDKTEILTPLKKWDSLSSSGVKTVGTGEVVLNGNENLQVSNISTNTIRFKIDSYLSNAVKVEANGVATPINYDISIYNKDEEGILVTNPSGHCYLRINKTRLDIIDSDTDAIKVQKLKTYLQNNNIKIQYELAEPITEQLPQTTTLNSFRNGTIEVNTNIPTTYTETHTVTDDKGTVLTLSTTEGLAKTLLVEVDCTGLCNSLAGGDNNAFKQLIKSIECNLCGCGSGIKDGILTNECKFLVSNGTIFNLWKDSQSDSINRLVATSTTSAKAYIQNNNKIYILMHSLPSGKDDKGNLIPSSLSLDYFNLKLDLVRMPDKVLYEGKEYMNIELGDTWSILLKGIAFSKIKSDDDKNKHIFTMYKDDGFSIRSYIDNKSGAITFFTHNGEKTILPYVSANWMNSIKRFQCCNLLFMFKDDYGIVKILINGETIQEGKFKLNDNYDFKGKYKLYLGSNKNADQADAFLESFQFFNNKIFTDNEIENILHGTMQGFENPNLIPKFNEVDKNTGKPLWHIHPNAIVSEDGNTLILNATEAWQGSWIGIPVLPNNRYELKCNKTINGRIDCDMYYNNVLVVDNVSKEKDIIKFISSSKTNIVKIFLTNPNTGTFTFSNLELRRVD